MKSIFSSAVILALGSAATLDHEGNQAVRQSFTRQRRPAARPAPMPVQAPRPAPQPVQAPEPVVAAPAPVQAVSMRQPVVAAPAPRPMAPRPAPVEEKPADALLSTGPINFAQEPFVAAAMIEGGQNAIKARMIENEEVSRMARQLEIIYPKDGAQRKSAWWRPTTAVRPGRTFARLGEGQAYAKDHYGNVYGGNKVQPQHTNQIATRPRVYPYSGYGWGQPGYVRQPQQNHYGRQAYPQWAPYQQQRSYGYQAYQPRSYRAQPYQQPYQQPYAQECVGHDCESDCGCDYHAQY